MFRIRAAKLQNYHPIARYLIQTCFSCFDNKRYICLLIFLFLTIPTLYFISNTSLPADILEDVNVCSKLLDILYNSNRSLCSKEADRRGNKQQIISLALFGPKENPIFTDEKFSQLISPLLDEAELLFPSWTIRLYADQLTIHRLNLKNLSRLATNIDICNINRIPILGNVGEYLSGKLWRFLPTLDPMVDVVSSRDLDSPLTEREQTVIEQFLSSTYLFLTLRDHPLHGVPILGGLWTCAVYRNRLLFLRLFSILLDQDRVKRYTLAHDQTLLNDLIWPRIKDQTLAYDSYTCQEFHEGHQHPFPTQRPSRECHLGCVRPCCQNSSNIILTEPCPEQCRPKNHPEWIYC
jgi:hypothetical protein